MRVPDEVASVAHPVWGRGEPPTEAFGRRLVLRPYQPSDAAAVTAAIVESQVSLARWVPDIARRQSLEQVRAGLIDLAHGCAAGRKLVFGIWDRDQDTFLGEVGLYAIDHATGAAELGYWLRTAARGRGVATGAVRELQQCAVDGLGLRRLEAFIAEDNLASRRVAERTGFRLIGRRPAGRPSSVEVPTGTERIYAYTPGVAWA